MASVLITLLTTIFPALVIFDPLILVLADIIIGYTTVVVNAAFTSTVYDHLQTYFHCALDASGQLTAAGLETVRTEITDNESPTVAAVCDGIFAIVGWVGINNWGASGTVTGDCSGDNCITCWAWLFDIDHFGVHSQYHVFSGGYTGASTALTAACVSGTADINADVRMSTNGVALAIDRVEFIFDNTGVANYYVLGLVSDNIVTPTGQVTIETGTTGAGAGQVLSVNVGASYYGIQFIFDIPNCANNEFMYRINVYATQSAFAASGITTGC